MACCFTLFHSLTCCFLVVAPMPWYACHFSALPMAHSLLYFPAPFLRSASHLSPMFNLSQMMLLQRRLTCNVSCLSTSLLLSNTLSHSFLIVSWGICERLQAALRRVKGIGTSQCRVLECLQSWKQLAPCTTSLAVAQSPRHQHCDGFVFLSALFITCFFFLSYPHQQRSTASQSLSPWSHHLASADRLRWHPLTLLAT